MKINEVIETFIEQLWNQRQFQWAEELFPTNFVARPIAYQSIWHGTGPESMKQHIQEWLQGVPDLHMQPINTLIQGNQCFVRWEMSGTHTGVLYGVPATGKPIKALGITFFEIENGKIRELQTLFDALGLMQQLEVLPDAIALIQEHLRQLEN